MGAIHAAATITCGWTARHNGHRGNLCWTDEVTAGSFIWRFHDGLNTMHDWRAANGDLMYTPGAGLF